MSEARHKNEDWAQAWIDEQREKLRSSAGNAGESRDDPDRASLWAKLGSEWLAGFEKAFQSGFGTLGAPPLGWAREHEQDWRNLAVAQAEYRRLESELLAKLLTIQSEALDLLERAVRERAAAGRPFDEIRELYHLWIECGEAVYGEMAHSDEYCRLQSAYGNAGVRLRAQQKKILERALKQFDLPTRSELNSVHRELRALRERLDELRERPSPSARRPQGAKRASGPSRARPQERKRR